MKRRAFVASMAAVMLSPSSIEAQQSTKPRIGWLTSSEIHQRNVNAFRQGMRALGYGDITLEFRVARGDVDRLPGLAAELVTLGLDVIVTDGGAALPAAQRATRTIPIVIGATAADVVRDGMVASVARPGGNITGFVISTGAELYGKRLQILREAMPGVTHVGVVWNARNDVARMALASVASAAEAMALTVDLIEVRDAQDIGRAVGGVAGRRVGAILTIADPFFWSQRARIVVLINRQRLPAMYPEVEFAEAGGLMGYGPNVPDNFRRAAGYVDRILKGANPGELPIELPTKFDLALNLKTARDLGLTIPPSLLLRADQVLE
jgi:putative tryptophan/tyrosine transport system substrate-binding protein